MTEYLIDLPVLVIDCQATGANPETGHLIETAWMIIHGVGTWKPSPKPPLSSFLRIPETADIPKKVQQITGIVPEDLTDANPPEKAWIRLLRDVEKIADAHGRCPTVIHFSRYERPFLEKLHHDTLPDTPFPLDIVCTHEIVRRLFPELPRKGLRAAAGYFGHTVSEKRRSSDHVMATGIIWQHCVAELSAVCGIHTYEALLDWLKRKPTIANGRRSYPMDPKIRLGLPDEPGIYRMRRSNQDLLYIGKALSLKHRVNSYFQKKRKHPEHTLEMLTQAKGLDITVTGSALEAAVVESDEIKKLKPPYNIALREKDRSVWFCSRDFSRISKTPDTSCCIGPITSADDVNSLNIIMGLITGTQNGVADLETVAASLGLPMDYAPDVDVFNDGFQIFFSRYGSFIEKRSIRSALLRLGAIFWQQRQAEKEAAQRDAEDPLSIKEDETPEPEWVWTPEAVSDGIARCIARGAYHFRRARWFLLLSDALVSWHNRRPEAAKKHVILFNQGRNQSIDMVGVDDPLPVPRGFRRHRKDRLSRFDLITYDRMRVVTTEIRRLVSEGRVVDIRLSKTAFLRNDALERLFRWV